jgi:serine/threonine protein kinase
VSNIAPFVYATDVSVNGTYLKKKNDECAGSQGQGILMGHSGTFLLDDGDELHISESVWLIFYSVKPVEKHEFTAIQEREKAIFAQDYLVTGRLLGQGGYGKVLIGVDQATQHQLACKMVPLDHLYNRPPAPNLRLPTGQHEQSARVGKKRWPTRVAACFREFDILKDLSHPNIISIAKVFWSNNTIYIFQELVTGGDLFSFLEYKGGRLDNAQATVVIRQVLLGVEYLHAQEIVHRDLKPDNILMTSLEDGARVVITDFGNSRFLPGVAYRDGPQTAKHQRMFSYVGTLEFAAPEIHKANPTIPAEEGYSKSVDMWSLGSITAILLTGDYIFSDCTHPDYRKDPRQVIVGLAAQCDLSVLDDEYHPLWSNVGRRPKDFIKRLLVLQEDERMTATEALAHVWFTNECYAEDLEELYARSTKDWQPRLASSQLVERISKSLPDLTAVGRPGHAMNQDTVSRFFHPSEQEMTQNIMQTLAASQNWRANISLPSVRDDYANTEFLFASQIVPSSHESEDASRHDDSAGSIDQQHQYYDEYGTAEHEEDRCDGLGNTNDEPFEVTTQQQQSTFDNAAQDEYGPSLRNSDQGGSYESAESLNNVKAVAYSQYPYSAYVRQPQIHAPSELIPLQETPFSQGATDHILTPEESYQTQFPEEYQRARGTEEEQNSVLVYETPPGG